MSGEYISRESLGLTDFEIIMCDGDYKEGLRLLLEKIENAPAADVVERPRWIPVTERLPEERKYVLCKCRADIIDVLRFENAEWYHDPTHVYMYGFVTHWMPLPEPPKE